MSETIDAERRRKIDVLATEVCGMRLEKHDTNYEPHWEWIHPAPSCRRVPHCRRPGYQGVYADDNSNGRLAWNPFASYADMAFVQERLVGKNILPPGCEQSLWRTYIRCLAEILGTALAFTSLAHMMLATPAERAEAAFVAGTKVLGACPPAPCCLCHSCALIRPGRV